jgi:hypothetical protein
MANPIHPFIQRFLFDTKTLQLQFEQTEKSKDIGRLDAMRKTALYFETMGGMILSTQFHTDYEIELVNLEVAKLMSIEIDLKGRIQVLTQSAKAISLDKTLSTTPSSTLKILTELVDIIFKKETREKTAHLFYLLDIETREKICKNLWRIKGCPTPESKIPSIKAIAHPNFGVESFLDGERRCASYPHEKALAVQLCITPSLLLQQSIQFIQSDKSEKALPLLRILPQKIQEIIFKRLSDYEEYDPDVFLALIIDPGVSLDSKVRAISDVNETALQSELDNEAAIEKTLKELSGLDSFFPIIAIDEIVDIWHENAEKFVGILETSPFVRSSMQSPKKILEDYHKRYPSLLHSRLFFLLNPAAFIKQVEPLLDKKLFNDIESSEVASATASAFSRTLGRVIQVISGGSLNVRTGTIDGTFTRMPSPKIKEASAGTGECSRSAIEPETEPNSPWVIVHSMAAKKPLIEVSQSKRISFDAAPVRLGTTDKKITAQTPYYISIIKKVLEARTLAPSPDDGLRLHAISPQKTIIALQPKLLRNCPEELRDLVTQVIMLDCHVTEYITGQSIFHGDLSPYHIESISWELQKIIVYLDKSIDTLKTHESTTDVRDVIDILTIKQNALVNTFINLFNYTSARTLSYEEEILRRLPNRRYERPLIDSRINRHREDLKLLEHIDPISPMIAKLKERIKELEKYKLECPTSPSELEGELFIEMYEENLLLANFWLDPLTIERLMRISGVYERMYVIKQLKKDTSRIQDGILEAEAFLSNMANGEIKMAFLIEIQALKDQLLQVERITPKYTKASILAKRDFQRKFFSTLPSRSIDCTLLDRIKKGNLENAVKFEENLFNDRFNFPDCYNAARELLIETEALMRTC